MLGLPLAVGVTVAVGVAVAVAVAIGVAVGLPQAILLQYSSHMILQWYCVSCNDSPASIADVGRLQSI